MLRERVKKKTRACNKHGLLATDYFDRNFLANFARLTLEHPGAHNIGKHAFPNRGKYLVPTAVEVLTEDNLIIAFRISSSIQGCCNKSR